MPNSGIALRVRGFAQPPPGRGVRVGVSPLNAGWELSARAPRGSAGTAPGSARPARLLWALPAEFGVAAGRVCVKLEKEDGRLFSPSSFTLKMARAATTSQGGEGDNNSRGERTSPKQKGGAQPSLCRPHSRSAECGTVRRRAALTVRPEPSSSLPSRVTRRVCVRSERRGELGNFNICAALLFGLWRGTGISALFLLLTTLSAHGGGGAGGQLWSVDGKRDSESLGLRGNETAFRKDYPDTGVRRKRSRAALAVLCKGEQQRTLILTDEYRSLPSFPSSHFRRITVPVFVVWFQLGRSLTVTPFRLRLLRRKALWQAWSSQMQL